MTVRRILLFTLLALGALASPVAAAAAPAPAPNIVVLMTDDQTVADMSAMPRTRALIGDRGVDFANSYSSYPLCCPARATLITGQYAHNHNVLGNRPPVGGYEGFKGTGNTLPVWLQKEGYATIHVGKYLNGYGRGLPAGATLTVPPGWTEWFGSVDPWTYFMWGYRINENGVIKSYGEFSNEDPALYQTDVYRNKAIDQIRRHSPSTKPFFMNVAFLAPHAEGEQGLVRSAPRHRGKMANVPVPRPPSFNEADVSDKPKVIQDSFPSMTAAEIADLDARHRSRVESLLAVDEAIAAIVRALDDTGELDNTLVIFASDNGHFGGEHRVPQGKYLAYEPSSRVPVMMRGPGVKRGAVARAFTINTDLAPTILDAAGAKPGRVQDGWSLLPFARDPKRGSKRPVLLETGESAKGDIDQDFVTGGIGGGLEVPIYNGVRTQRYVYLEYSNGERELYDMKRDPGQMNSVHADPRYRRARSVLDKVLTKLSRCRGSACRADAPPVPGPSPR